jgi:hypothetical protein
VIAGSLKFTWVKLHRFAGAGTNLRYALGAVSGLLERRLDEEHGRSRRLETDRRRK